MVKKCENKLEKLDDELNILEIEEDVYCEL